MKLKGHHVYGVGVLTGLGVASYRVWLVIALAFLLGCAVTLVVVNARSLVHWLRDILDALKLQRAEKQVSRLQALKDRRAERKGFPRGY